jgi:lipopolysaccharide transport system permease protein
MSTSNKSLPVREQPDAGSEFRARPAGIKLPDAPVVVIEPKRNSLNLRELWQYRDLLYVLTLRDIKVRYKQTVLGILWAIMQPLFMMIVFTIFFSRLAGIPSDGVPYSLFAYAGLVPWTFLSNAVVNSGNSLVGNSSLITKVYFPRMVIPLAAVGAGLIDFFIAFGLLVLLMFYHGVGLSLNILMLPILTLLTALLAAGFGMWTSAINVKYRDVRHALPFLVQVWMFATPIIYPFSLVPEKWRWLFLLNPLTGLIEAYRSAIFGKPFDLPGLAASTVIILLILTYSMIKFRQMERSFADIV